MVLHSCREKAEIPEIDWGYEYFPLEVGNWAEYKVDSIVYDDFNNRIDTFTFWITERCVEEYFDLEGRRVFRFESTYYNEEDTNPHRTKSTAYVLIDGRLECLINNTKRICLIFPPKEGDQWDANALNTYGELNYVYESVHQSLDVGDLNFDSTLHLIRQNDTNNFIVKRFSEVSYARNVGLVFERYFHIETQFEIDSGLQYIRRITDFGGNQF